MTCSLKLLGHEKERTSACRGGWVKKVFVDLSRAFNTVWPHLMEQKLLKMDVNQHLILLSLYFWLDTRRSVQLYLDHLHGSVTGSPVGRHGITFWDVKSSCRLRWTPSTSRPEEKDFFSEPSQRPWTSVVRRSWYKPTFRPVVESSGGSTDPSYMSCRTDLRSDTAVKTFTLVLLHKVSNGTIKLFYCYLKISALYF